MSYGLPKEVDSPENNKKVERCVAEQVKQGRSKISAIRICKASIIKSHMLRKGSE